MCYWPCPASWVSLFICLAFFVSPSFVARRHPRHETFCSSNCLGPTGMYFGALFLAVWFSTKPQAFVRFRIRTASLWFLIFSTTDRIVSAVEVAAGKSTRQQMGQAIREAFLANVPIPQQRCPCSHFSWWNGVCQRCHWRGSGQVQNQTWRAGSFYNAFQEKRQSDQWWTSAQLWAWHQERLGHPKILWERLVWPAEHLSAAECGMDLQADTRSLFQGFVPWQDGPAFRILDAPDVYGGGWNVIVSPNKITAVVHEHDVKAAFKAMGKLLSFWIFWTGSDNPRAPSGYLLGYQVAQSETPHSWKQTHVFVARDQLFSPENCIFLQVADHFVTFLRRQVSR